MEYLTALLATVKLTRKKLAEKEEELSKWEKRIELAREKQKTDLLHEAENRFSILTGETEILREEERELSLELAKLDSRFDQTSAAIRELEREAELEAMKKALQDESSRKENT